MTPLPLSKLIEEFLHGYEPPIRSKTTCRLMRQSIRELIEDRSLILSTDLTPAALWRWVKRYPDRTLITRSLHLRNLRVLCNFAAGSGHLTASPFAYDSKLRKACHIRSDKSRRRHHSIDEVGCVLGYLRDRSRLSWEDGRLYALVATVAYTGVRSLEAAFAEVADFDLAAGFFEVRPKPSHPLKTESSERDVPIPPPLASVLREWLPRARSSWAFPGARRLGPWSSGSPGYSPLDRLKGAAIKVGVRGFTFLSLRHSFVTHSAGPWGLGSLAIETIVGHSQEDTKRHYMGRDRKNLSDAVSTISYPLPRPIPMMR